MKYLSLLLFLLFGLLQAQIVYIPDANFKNALLSSNLDSSIARDENGQNIIVDINEDGEIQQTEALRVYRLFMNSMDGHIVDLTGIKSFENLVYLKVDSNWIETLDLSGLSNLIDVSASSNRIEDVYLSGLSNLEKLNLNDNKVNNIDLTGLNSLKELTIKTFNLPILDVSKAPNLELLYMFGDDISPTTINLDGVANLERLNLIEVKVSNLSLSTNLNLKYLSVSSSNLTNLEVSHLSKLQSLGITYNQSLGPNFDFTSLPVSLKTLSSNNNLLNYDELDFTYLPNLESLDLSWNNIGKVKVDGLVNLEVLTLNSNPSISNMDFSTNVNLRSFECYNCPEITILDFSNNPDLENLSFHTLGYPTNVRYLNIKNSTIHLRLNEFQIPENCYICIDVNDYVQSGNYPPGMVANTYCSYFPSARHNRIKGEIRWDSNGDNVCSESDLPVTFTKINYTNLVESNYTFTLGNGQFDIFVDVGTFIFSPQLLNLDAFSISPIQETVSFNNLNNNEVLRNFCLLPNGDFRDVKISIMPLAPARPGFDATYKVIFLNKGTETVSGDISFDFFGDKMDFVSSDITPATQSENNLTFDFQNLIPFEFREIILTFNINAPTDTPPVNIGDWLSFLAEIEIADDVYLDDNTFGFRQEVIGSFDPNDILCLEGRSIDPVMIGEELHYRIRFENTGNYPAERVVVAMPINMEEYDISSFQLLNTSHHVQARVLNNTAEFFFENIDLVPNGEGYILFSIKSLESLQIGDSVMSYADIYFDYNYPITTNEELSIFEVLGIKDLSSETKVEVYPNPVKNQLNIQSDDLIISVAIFDQSGRIIHTSLVNKIQTTQNLSKISTGIYYLKLNTSKGTYYKKIIKE